MSELSRPEEAAWAEERRDTEMWWEKACVRNFVLSLIPTFSHFWKKNCTVMSSDN